MSMDRKLYDELIAECDRLTEIINSNEVGSPEWKDAYGKKLAILEKMGEFNKIDTEYFSKKESLNFEEKKLEHQAKIEASRREGELNLEREKQKIGWKRVSFEMAKLAIPMIISAWVYDRAQKKVFDFEEHGRITSTPGRQLGLPRFFK